MKNIFLKKAITICNAFAIRFSRMNDLSRSIVEKEKEIPKTLRLKGQALLGKKMAARVSSNLMFNV